MRIFEIYFVSIAISFLTFGCGTQNGNDNNDKQQPVNVYNQTPTTQTPFQPSTVPADLSTTENGDQNPSVTAENYSDVDEDGNPYDVNQTIPFDNQYGNQTSQQYDYNSENYYSDLTTQSTGFEQPYQSYQTDYQIPYLQNRYQQQRGFINYKPSFKHVRRGQGNWHHQRYDKVHSRFDTSSRWVNRNLYNQIYMNLDKLKNRKFSSRHHREDNVRSAIKRRDHRSAVRIHDELLDEAKQRRSERPSNNWDNGDNRDTRDTRDNRDDLNNRRRG